MQAVRHFEDFYEEVFLGKEKIRLFIVIIWGFMSLKYYSFLKKVYIDLYF
tara:strand:+ start:841 stop:990 length:150 start_codon:yes stop_codon:yes gene_type:complete